MERRYYTNPFVQEQEDPELGPDSPSSGDEAKVTSSSAPSPKKRKGVHKKVITVPIGDLDGVKSKGEAYPPSDSWAWRKYGQKPIKGSPYPRGYYRCSSSKGCPARKQVERSRVDPTMLLITYASDHNHPLPTAKHHHHHQPPPPAATAASPTSPDSPAAGSGDSPEKVEAETEHLTGFANQPDLDLGSSDSLALPPELDWLTPDVALLESPMCTLDGLRLYGDDVAEDYDMREEDASLFGDLGELPECSLVFRRGAVIPCIGNTG